MTSYVTILSLLCLVFLTSDVNTATGPNHDRVVVCYIATWSVYRPDKGSFMLDNVEPGLCTHLVYAFAGLNASSSSIRSLDPWQDLKDNYGKGNFEKATGLKDRYPHLKVTLAIGGWNEGSTNYSRLAASPAERLAFVTSAVQFLRMYKFDGLDLDWEYPGKRGGAPEDKHNFGLLVKELKTEFKKHNLLLTAALGASKETIDMGYDVPTLNKYLDFLHLMCYDYHGTWDGTAMPNAPLRGSSASDDLSVEFTVNYMLSLGATVDKLVLGLPLYGRTFVKQGDSPETLGASVKAIGFQGPYTRETGFMGFNEICTELSNSSAGWSQHWDPTSQTPYAVNKERIIMFDNQRSLAEKVRFAMNKNLRGVMVWSMDTDDFRGDCPQEDDIYVEFYQGLKDLQENPYYKEIVNHLPMDKDGVELLPNNRNAYKIQNGDLTLVIPQRTKTNFPLMRTLSESIILSDQENKIRKEIDMKIKEKERENEVHHGAEHVSGAVGISAKIVFVVLAVLPMLR